MTPQTRNDLPRLLNHLGLTGEAVEVGCAEGYYSFHILTSWGGRLTMVDPWAILDTPGFSGHGEATNEEQEARYQRILQQAKRFGERCVVKRATSEQAAGDFANESLDYVYIDAIHTAEASAQDIALWWPKVKSTGILAGHDYLSGVFNGQDYGVKDSADAFAIAHGLTVNKTQEHDWPSFWIVKP